MCHQTLLQVLVGNLAVFRILVEAHEHPVGRIDLDRNLDARLVPELFHEPQVFRKQASLAGEAQDGRAVECGQPIHLHAVLLEEPEPEAALAARAAQTVELVRLEQQESSLPLVAWAELASQAWRAVECGLPVRLLVVQAEPQRQARASAPVVRKQ